MNLYSYAANNPLLFVDIYGLDECIWGGFSGDLVIGIGGQLIIQEGKCKNECGEWEWKNRNCICWCYGLSAGGTAGGGKGNSDKYDKEISVGIGPVSVGTGGVGIGKGGVKIKGVGAKIGIKRCSCYCDVF